MGIKNKSANSSSSRNDTFSYLDKVEIPKHERDFDWTPFLAAFIIIAVIALFVIWIYSLLPHHTNSPSSTATTKTLNGTVKSAKQQNTSAYKTYNSSNLNLSFEYPDNWNVKDSGDGFLTATSPEESLVGANGKKVQGIINLAINNQKNYPTGFTSGTAVAVMDSQLLSYSSPAIGQSAQTYISFVQYASTVIKGGLDSIFVTGNNGYQKGQVIPTTDMNNISPFIAIYFSKCDNKKCTQTSPLTVKSSAWNSTTFSSPILTALKSLIIQ